MSQGKHLAVALPKLNKELSISNSKAKLFLKFSWQPASPVIYPFDVCFKNLAHTHKL